MALVPRTHEGALFKMISVRLENCRKRQDACIRVERERQALKAEVIFRDQTMELPLSARFNTPGAYESVFFPSQPGDYTFRIYGTLDGADVDESFTSSPEGFGAVEDPAPLHFPK